MGDYERGVLDGIELAMAAGANAGRVLEAVRADRLRRVVTYFGLKRALVKRPPEVQPGNLDAMLAEPDVRVMSVEGPEVKVLDVQEVA